MEIIVGIDASRCRSGGVISHLIGLLNNFDPVMTGVKEIHVWSFKSLLDQLPDKPWLIKHNPPSLEKNIFIQLIWQAVVLAKELRATGCNVLYTQSASSLCFFSPNVVGSQDMLSYEPGVMKYYGYSLYRLRLLGILLLQNLAFRRAEGVIFLNHYSSKIIQKSCGELKNITFIPHAANEVFRQVEATITWPFNSERPIRCIYISNIDMYKHQWKVIEAISLLRMKGYNVKLQLVGEGTPKAEKLVKRAIEKSIDGGTFVERVGFVPHREIPTLLAKSDLFVFASSCETMPVTLLEGMSAGMPIACSDRGPMPEMLGSGGIYFNPESTSSISNALEKIISSSEIRLNISKQAKNISLKYSWKKCSNDTFRYISKVYNVSKA